jgi:hypothetical protein
MVLQSRLLILFKPKISYPFNGLILLCIAFYRRTKKLSHKSSEIGIVPSLYLQEIVLALKGFRQKQGLFGTPF